MFKVFKKGGKDKEGKEAFELRFRFHATRVPLNGYKQLQVSIVTSEKNKETARTSAVAIRNGACQWPDTITETVQLVRDKRTNQLESKVFKFVVSTGQSRGGVLGDASFNIAECHLSSQVEQKALPLKNCNAGTVLNVTLQMIPLTGPRDDEDARSETTDAPEQQEVQDFTDDELSEDDNPPPPPVNRSMEVNRSFQAPNQKSTPLLDLHDAQLTGAIPWAAQANGHRVTPAASHEMDDQGSNKAEDLRMEYESLQRKTKKLTQQVESLSEQLEAAASEREKLRKEAEIAKLQAAQNAGGQERVTELEDSLAEQRGEAEGLRNQLSQMQESNAVLLEEIRDGEERQRRQHLEMEEVIQKAKKAEEELGVLVRMRDVESRLAEASQESSRSAQAEQEELIEELTQKLRKAEEDAVASAKSREMLAASQEENSILVQELAAAQNSARTSANQAKQIDDLEKEATELAQENFQIAQDLSQTKAILSVKDREIGELQAEIAKLRDDELKFSREQIIALEAEVGSLTRVIAKLKDEQECATNERIAELEAEVRKLKARETEQVMELEEEVQKLRAQLSEAEDTKTEGFAKALNSQLDPSELASKLAEAEEETRLTKSHSKELELELAALGEQLAAAQKALDSSSHSSARIAELEAELERHSEVNAQLKKASETAEALGGEVVRLHQQLAEETSRANEVELKVAAESASAERIREESNQRVTEAESALEKVRREVTRLEAELARVLGEVNGGDEADVAARRAEAAVRAVADMATLETRVKELESELADLEGGEEGRKFKELNDEVARLSQEREQLTRQVEVRDGELERLRQEKVLTSAKMMTVGMRKGTVFSPPRGSDESLELRMQIQKLEDKLQQKEDELVAAQKKTKTAEILAATIASESANAMAEAKGDGARNQEDIVGPLYRKIRALETLLAEAKEENKQTEKVLREQISKLEFANEQLMGIGGDRDGAEQLHHELMRLQHQNASMQNRERELTTMLSKQEVLEFEVERLQELNDELQQRLMIQRDVMEGVKTVERLEMELNDALELNRLYKGQLKNALASSQNVQSAAIHNLGSPDQVIEDLRMHKKKNHQLESDLKDLRQRYAELSLKLVENEQQREDLFMKLKQARLGATATPNNSSARLLDRVPSFAGLWGDKSLRSSMETPTTPRAQPENGS